MPRACPAASLIRSTPSFILRPWVECSRRSRRRWPIRTSTCEARTICSRSRRAEEFRTSCSPHRAASTASTHECLGVKTTSCCNRSVRTRAPKSVESYWVTSTVIYTASGSLPCAFSRCTGPGSGPIWRFTSSRRLIDSGRPVPVFGDGNTRRDYTYVADIVAGVCAALRYDRSQYEVINLGNNADGHGHRDDSRHRRGNGDARDDRLAAGTARRRASDVGQRRQGARPSGLRTSDAF